MEGLIGYGVFFLTLAGIYAVLALGLNVQWGFTGMFNVGVAAFFAVGAYTSGILTTPDDPSHLGGFGLPFPVGAAGAMVAAGILGLAIGLLTLNLRSDYLAIASIGIAETVRLVIKNETAWTGGVRGMTDIPRPLNDSMGEFGILSIVLVSIAAVYFLCERAWRSPWGRVLRAVRDREPAARAMGKNAMAFRLQAFVFGCSIMGLAGALYAHFIGFISPEAFEPLFGTFLVWVMLIAGGSGNNRGAILGAFLIWGVWSGTEIVLAGLPGTMVTQAGALRVLLIGVLLQAILILRPQGVLKETPPKPG